MIFDILSSNTGVGNNFVVDNTLTEKALVGPPGTGNKFSNAAARDWFEKGDNLILTGFWMNIPFGFGQGTGSVSLSLFWEDGAGAFTVIPELADPSSTLNLPNFCGPLEFPPNGLFIRVPTTGATKFRLTNLNSIMNISQINAPAILQGTTQKVQFHLRVLHTLPIAAVS
jgi:hypothetical protein